MNNTINKLFNLTNETERTMQAVELLFEQWKTANELEQNAIYRKLYNDLQVPLSELNRRNIKWNF